MIPALARSAPKTVLAARKLRAWVALVALWLEILHSPAFSAALFSGNLCRMLRGLAQEPIGVRLKAIARRSLQPQFERRYWIRWSFLKTRTGRRLRFRHSHDRGHGRHLAAGAGTKVFPDYALSSAGFSGLAELLSGWRAEHLLRHEGHKTGMKTP